MSGHSKWAQIKRQKGAADQKRGVLFTKLANVITHAARELGGNPETNFKLRLAIDQARSANMPKENIERAIKRGTGELEGARLEEVTYECFGPGGTAYLIEALTGNKNRTVSTIKHLFLKFDGSLGSSGSVSWMFQRKGVIRSSKLKEQSVKTKEDLELKIIEAGAEDIEENDEMVIYTKPQELRRVKEALAAQNIPTSYAEIEWVAKEKIKIKDGIWQKKTENLWQELDENPEVSNFYTNTEM